ncbi:MAG: hypothetical protein NC209_07290 [Alistipes sp.]|nr:hypothetical protein [Alistipes senegalensis]MCM1250927.1 hypothetical protein [Alistipes sp.]
MNREFFSPRLAHALSWALHPFLLPLYLVAFLLLATPFAYYPAGMKLYLAWVIVLYVAIIPVLGLCLLRSLGRISDWRIDAQRERRWPLLIGTACYVLCAITLAKLPSAVFLRKFMLAAACCEAMCLVVSFYWKISLHLTAMGAAVALLVIMSIVDPGRSLVPLLLAVFGAGALASARLHLGCHNGAQVLAGFCGGFCISALALLFL